MKHGLTIGDIPSDEITEELGIDKEQYVSLCTGSLAAMFSQTVLNSDIRPLESFIKYLESKEADATGFKPEKPNDYFMLGLVFFKSKKLVDMAHDGMHEGIKEEMGSEPSPLDMLMRMAGRK